MRVVMERQVMVGTWRATADYHTHTTYSRSTHARGTVEDNVTAAIRCGLREVAITDHGPAGLWYGLRTPERFFALADEAERVGRVYPQIKVLLGLEANLVSVDGDIDATPEMIDRMDLLLVGFHPHVRTRRVRDFFKLVGRNAVASRLPAVRALMPRLRSENTRALVLAVERYPVDIVTHPGLRIDIDTGELAAACTRRGTLLEINTAHRRTTLDFIRLAHERGARFVIDSDAHDPHRVGDLEWGMQLAQRAGLHAEEVANVEEVNGANGGTGSPT